MRFIFIVFFIGLLNFTKGQEKSIYVEYQEKQIYRHETTAILIAGKNEAVYKEMPSSKKSEIKIESVINGSDVAYKPEVKMSNYYKTKDSPIIYYTEYIVKDDTPYAIYDSIPKLDWKFLTDETDTIQGYVCNVAKLKFRGSNLTAYYTLDIPISFGPWKFDGLPGLVIKIVDDQNPSKIYWEATKIIYPYKKSTNISFDRTKHKLSLKEFIILSYKIYSERNKKFISKVKNDGGVITHPKVKMRPMVVEKIYEWEKEGDIWGFYEDYYKKNHSR